MQCSHWIKMPTVKEPLDKRQVEVGLTPGKRVMVNHPTACPDQCVTVAMNQIRIHIRLNGRWYIKLACPVLADEVGSGSRASPKQPIAENGDDDVDGALLR